MAVPLPPRTWQCIQCGWKITDLSSSDAIMRIDTCPKCGGTMEMRAATLPEIFFARLERMFGK